MSQSHLPAGGAPACLPRRRPRRDRPHPRTPRPPAGGYGRPEGGQREETGAFGADLYGWLQALTFALAFYLDLLHLLRPRDRRGRPLHGPHPQRPGHALSPVHRL